MQDLHLHGAELGQSHLQARRMAFGCAGDLDTRLHRHRAGAQIGQRQWPAPARCQQTCQQAVAGGLHGGQWHRRLVVGGCADGSVSPGCRRFSAAFAARCRRGRRSLDTGLRRGRDLGYGFRRKPGPGCGRSCVRPAFCGWEDTGASGGSSTGGAEALAGSRPCVDAATRAVTAGACRATDPDGDTVGAGVGVGVGVGVASAATGMGAAEWSAAGRRQAPRAGRRGVEVGASAVAAASVVSSPLSNGGLGAGGRCAGRACSKAICCARSGGRGRVSDDTSASRIHGVQLEHGQVSWRVNSSSSPSSLRSRSPWRSASTWRSSSANSPVAAGVPAALAGTAAGARAPFEALRGLGAVLFQAGFLSRSSPTCCCQASRRRRSSRPPGRQKQPLLFGQSPVAVVPLRRLALGVFPAPRREPVAIGGPGRARPGPGAGVGRATAAPGSCAEAPQLRAGLCVIAGFVGTLAQPLADRPDLPRWPGRLHCPGLSGIRRSSAATRLPRTSPAIRASVRPHGADRRRRSGS